MYVIPLGRAFAVVDEGLILRTLPTRNEAESWINEAENKKPRSR